MHFGYLLALRCRLQPVLLLNARQNKMLITEYHDDFNASAAAVRLPFGGAGSAALPAAAGLVVPAATGAHWQVACFGFCSRSTEVSHASHFSASSVLPCSLASLVK